MNDPYTYTAIVRKSELEYVAICLELNITARGSDLEDVERNLRDAIKLYLEDIEEFPETQVSAVTSEELIEFLQDTEPQTQVVRDTGLRLRPFELREVPAYV